MLRLIKTLHTIIWFIMVSAIGYILYAGITKTYDVYLLVSLLLLVTESTILIMNHWTCPLTPIARKYTKDTADNFDIYLPLWLARYNKHLFGTLLLLGILLLLIRTLS